MLSYHWSSPKHTLHCTIITYFLAPKEIIIEEKKSKDMANKKKNNGEDMALHTWGKPHSRRDAELVALQAYTEVLFLKLRPVLFYFSFSLHL